MAGTQGGEGQTGDGNPGDAGPNGGSAGITEAGQGRDNTRGAGVDPSAWPAEYRGFMDAYFEAVEEAP